MHVSESWLSVRTPRIEAANEPSATQISIRPNQGRDRGGSWACVHEENRGAVRTGKLRGFGIPEPTAGPRGDPAGFLWAHREARDAGDVGERMTYYTIAYRPIGSYHWSPIDPLDDRFCGWGYWTPDLLLVRKRCQYLNSLAIPGDMRGISKTSRLEFRVATIAIADHAEVAAPKGDRIEV